MQQSKFISLLKKLEAKERRQFLQFLESPLFNSNKKYLELYKHLLQFEPQFEASALNKSEVYSKLFGGATSLSQKMDNLLSELLNLLYEFIAFKGFKEDHLLQTRLLLDQFDQRALHSQIPGIAKRYERHQDKMGFRNESYYYHQMHLFQFKDTYELNTEKRHYNPFIKEQNNSLDLYYHLMKLRIATDMFSRSLAVNADYDTSFSDNILHYYNEQPNLLDDHPALKIYYLTLQMLKTPNEIHYFYQLGGLLEKYLPIFPESEIRLLYNYLLNFCIRKINSGADQFYQEILSLYQFLLKEKIILQNNRITQWTYINIVTAGLRLKNFDWTEQFVNEYKAVLAPSNRENVYTYSLVAIYFEKNDTDAALKLLQDVEFTDAFYHMSAKIIQLKIYYQEEAFDAFHSLILASQRYLSRNQQLSSYQKKSNLHFIKLINRLYKLKEKARLLPKARFVAQHQRLIQSIQNTNPLSNKAWLEAEVEQL